MSYLSSEYIQCETIQTMLDDQFATCVTPLDPMPALEAIIATQNANGIKQSVSGDDGKVKTIKVVYENRLLESDATEGSGARACTTSNETFNSYATYTIDPNVWISAAEKFTTADLATVCTTDVQGMIANKINKVVDVIERKIATKTATELVALYGEWGTNVSGTVNGSDELVLAQYTVTATKTIDYTSMPTLDLALQQTGYCAPAMFFGGSALYQYSQFVNHGCCAAAGVDVLAIARDYGKVVMYDKRVKDALGSELKSIGFQAGSLALLTYSEAAQVPNLGANYAKFRVNSPRTGIPIDIVMKDDCGTIHIVGYANTKLVGLPTDMFAVGDEYRGVTFVNKVLITNPA
jgi:hypothetical protein